PPGGDICRICLAGDIVGPVFRSVIDHNDADVLVGRHHHGPDRPDDYLFFVVGRNQNRHPRCVLWRCVVLPCPQTINDGADSDNDEAATHQDVTNKEDAHYEVIEEADEEECKGVCTSLPPLPWCQWRHHLVSRFAHQLGYWNDLVSAGTQSLNQYRKCVDGS